MWSLAGSQPGAGLFLAKPSLLMVPWIVPLIPSRMMREVF